MFVYFEDNAIENHGVMASTTATYWGSPRLGDQ